MIAFGVSVVSGLGLAIFELDHDPDGTLIPFGLGFGAISMFLALKIRRDRQLMGSDARRDRSRS